MSRARWAAYGLILALTAGLLTAAVCRVKPLLSANDRSRWCTVWSLVERGTFQIDEIDAVPGWRRSTRFGTRDISIRANRPLLPMIVAGVYWLVRAVTGWTLDDQTDEAARTILLIVNVMPLLVGDRRDDPPGRALCAERFCADVSRRHVCAWHVSDDVLGHAQ